MCSQYEGQSDLIPSSVIFSCHYPDFEVDADYFSPMLAAFLVYFSITICSLSRLQGITVGSQYPQTTISVTAQHSGQMVYGGSAMHEEIEDDFNWDKLL